MTWVHELGRHWPFGIPPWGQIGRYGKPLVAQYPFSQVEIHFIHFCAAAKREVDQDPEKRKYWTLARFSEFFLTWGPPARSPVFTAYKPVSKVVREEVGGRWRLVRVPIEDPRPEA